MTDPLPPHDLEAERYLLSCFGFQAVATAQRLIGEIEPSDFYSPAHRLIFETLVALVADGVKPDAVTVRSHLTERGLLEQVGGSAGIAAATLGWGGVSSNAPAYARTVNNLARLRDLQALEGEIGELVTSGDAAKAAEVLLEKVQAVVDATNGRVNLRTVDEMAPAWLDVLEERQQGRGLGIPTGWRELDAKLQGMREGELWIVGAGPKVGKSAWSGNLAVQVMEQGYKVLMVSLEMTETELMDRFMAAKARVRLERLRTGDISLEEHQRLAKATGEMLKLPFVLLDDPNAGLAEVHAAAVRTSPDLIIIDYTQLMRAESRRNGTRQDEVAGLTAGLKRLAREMRCPVVALSQTKRDADDRRPERADMAESSSFERNANVVLGLYRDELVNPGGRRGVMEVIVIYSRHTEGGTVELAYVGHHQRLSDMATAPPREPYRD